MNEADIRKYAEMMQELGLTGLEITEDNKKIRLERMAAPAQTAVINAAPAVPTSAPAPIENTDFISVKSPIIGVFYAAPAENAEPYVKVGDQVKKGQTLCLIEAMKLMNEITADQDGVISEICVTNGSIVEFGTELFRIKR
mgnify:FL=1